MPLNDVVWLVFLCLLFPHLGIVTAERGIIITKLIVSLKKSKNGIHLSTLCSQIAHAVTCYVNNNLDNVEHVMTMLI